MTDLTAAHADLARRLDAELGLRVVGWDEIDAGRNNRLFRLATADGPPLLGKFYGRDPWGGHAREHATLAFLAARDFPAVPRPVLRSNPFAWAVYTFAPGATKGPADYTRADLRAAATFAAALHALDPQPDALSPTIEAAFSPADQIAIIHRRLDGFAAYAADPAAPPAVRALDLRPEIDRLIARATAGIAPAALARPLPRADWRLNMADFGPHNILIAADGGLTVVDWEWAGWDDPARMALGFVAHAASEGLPAGGVAAFLGDYAAARDLSSAEIARYERVGLLYDLEWVATYATALTAEAIATAGFAVPDFDAAAHRADTLARLAARLDRARSGIGYRFPR